jgi:EAL and modified HD-GYP domain-containing signal transduction protein
MCEHLGRLIDKKVDNFFLIGILSNLDSILDLPIEEAMEQLPLANDIKAAILNKEGLAGEALDCVINYEQWDIAGMAFHGVDRKLISEAYYESINWAKDVLISLD